jgi:AcrR family transcriptional regulator
VQTVATPPAEPLGRRERKKERTRREIFESAMRLFVARGFEAVTIEEICSAADVARATFFLHFPGKTALLGEYGRAVTDELADLLAAHRGSASEALRRVFRFLGERVSAHPEMVQLITREVVARPVALESHGEQARSFTHVLAQAIARGQASGEFRRDVDPLLAAAVAASAYFAVVFEWSRQGGAIDLETAIDQVLDVVARGIQPRPAAASRRGAAARRRRTRS